MKRSPSRIAFSVRVACTSSSTFLGALLIAGCATGARMPTGLPAQLNASVAVGRSANLHSGSHFAYWVWKEDDGTWHIRTTSARVNHHFQGSIHPDLAGSIQQLKGVNLAGPGRRGRGGDKLEMAGNDIVFDIHTSNTQAGLDFQIVGAPCLEFDLRLDGDTDASKIHLGKNQVKPDKSHFILCP